MLEKCTIFPAAPTGKLSTTPDSVTPKGDEIRDTPIIVPGEVRYCKLFLYQKHRTGENIITAFLRQQISPLSDMDGVRRSLRWEQAKVIVQRNRFAFGKVTNISHISRYNLPRKIFFKLFHMMQLPNYLAYFAKH